MVAEQASHANVVASMFENLSKCLTDNAALLRQLHARGLSGAMPGPSGAVPGPSAVVEAPSATKKRKADAAEPKLSKRTLSSYQLWMAVERDTLVAAQPELQSQPSPYPSPSPNPGPNLDRSPNPNALKAAQPEFQGKSKEIMSELGRRWKQLGAAAKKPFEDKAAQLKQENVAAQDKVRRRQGQGWGQGWGQGAEACSL